MPDDTLSSLVGIAHAHAHACQPAASLLAIDKAAAALVGHRLCTVLACDRGTLHARRIHTSMPDAYPVAGCKTLEESAWTRHVLEQGQHFIGNSPQDIREVFSDHALIVSLGCGSVLNQPVRWQGRTLGTLNLLHQPGWYQPGHVAIVQVLAQLALPALMACAPHATCHKESP